MSQIINNPVVMANNGFAIFFDDVRVDKFVKDYTVNMGVDSNIGTAVINMIYVPDFDKLIHDESEIYSTTDQARKQEPPRVETVTKKVTKAKVVNCYHLNVRSGPSERYAAIAWVDRGDVLAYHGRGGSNNYWVKVTSTNGKVGWVGGKYVSIFDETITETRTVGGGGNSRSSGSSGSSELTGTVTTQSTNLNVRSGPGTNYSRIGSLKKGASVKIASSSGGWHNIYYGSGKGWVSGQYITVNSQASSQSSWESSVKDGLTQTVDDGIECMTNVRIFVKNVFNNKYVQVFSGNITSKSISRTSGDKTLTFHAQDYMNWLSRTVCPIAIPFDGTLALGDRLKWKAQGIDINKVMAVNNVNDITFKGRNISQTWQIISDQTLAANKIYSNSDTVSKWDDALSRIVVMGDIDENLRKAEVMDFVVSSSLTQVNSTYVLMNDILRTLMFEFYQDRDETIRIKPPFWNEHVLKNHVIDASLILSYTETSDYNRMYTRVIATGGLEEWHKTEGMDDMTVSLITPVVAVTSSGIEVNSGPVVSTGGGATGGGTGSNIATSAVSVAKQYIGWPYVWGGDKPSEGGFDCSGLIDYAYKQSGYTGFGARETTKTLVNKGRAVTSLNDVRTGDLIFPHADHVYMVVDSSTIIHAPKKGENIRTQAMPKKFWKIRRIVEWDGKGNTSTVNYVKPESVGPDSLLEPTHFEKKYGPLIYDTSQPLIKFSTSGATNSTSAYDALTKYARFMLGYLNSSVTMASMQTIAMPWIRPGFNVWVDPAGTDKVYYVNSLNHYGNQSGNYTTFNMSLGRRRDDFVNKPEILGGLKPGKSDDIFVNTLMVTPENFGEVCNYSDIAKRVKNFYGSSRTDRIEVSANHDYFNHLYGVSERINAYSNDVATSAPTQKPTTQTSNTGTVRLNSGTLNVRSGAGTNYSRIGSLKNGATVTIRSEKSGWYNIDYGSNGGWVSGNYISKNDAPKSPTPDQPNPTSKYRSKSSKSVVSGDLTISDIENKLSSHYGSAPSVVKDRKNRLARIVSRSEGMMPQFYTSNLYDK